MSDLTTARLEEELQRAHGYSSQTQSLLIDIIEAARESVARQEATAEADKLWRSHRGPSLWETDAGWSAAASERSLLRPMPVVVKGCDTPTAAYLALRDALRERASCTASP
jgi:hypothetical protein